MSEVDVVLVVESLVVIVLVVGQRRCLPKVVHARLRFLNSKLSQWQRCRFLAVNDFVIIVEINHFFIFVILQTGSILRFDNLDVCDGAVSEVGTGGLEASSVQFLFVGVSTVLRT